MCELCCATVMAGNYGRHTCRQQNVAYLLMLSKYNIIRNFNDPCLFTSIFKKDLIFFFLTSNSIYFNDFNDPYKPVANEGYFRVIVQR